MGHLIVWIIVGIIYAIGAAGRAISNAAAKRNTRSGPGYPQPARPGAPPQFGAPPPTGQRPPGPAGQQPYGYGPNQQAAQYGNQPPAGQQPYGYTQPQQPAQYGNQPTAGQQYGYQAPPQYQGQSPAYAAPRPPQPGYAVVPPAPQYGYPQQPPPPVAPPPARQPRPVSAAPPVVEQPLSTLAESEPSPSTEASTGQRGFNDVLRSQPPLVAAIIMQEILGPPRSRRGPKKAV